MNRVNHMNSKKTVSISIIIKIKTFRAMSDELLLNDVRCAIYHLHQWTELNRVNEIISIFAIIIYYFI